MEVGQITVARCDPGDIGSHTARRCDSHAVDLGGTVDEGPYKSPSCADRCISRGRGLASLPVDSYWDVVTQHAGDQDSAGKLWSLGTRRRIYQGPYLGSWPDWFRCLPCCNPSGPLCDFWDLLFLKRSLTP